MSVTLALAVGALLGAAATALHIWLLHRALYRHTPGEALPGRSLAATMPVRIALWLPTLVIVARMGLYACLACLGSMLLTGGLLVWRIGASNA